ncbi:MAG: PQQ-dependent sugar dehydrogenase [Actinomycetota bacterium]|nr:PQQ-dependent sugar dehydrogenase [Actinomycetota bacterium]
MSHRRKHIRRTAALAAVVIGLGGLPVSADEAADAEAPRRAPVEQKSVRSAPSLQIRTVVSGLDKAWDVAFTPGGRMLITERDRARISVLGFDGVRRTLVERVPNAWVSGETGLMGITVDPRFRSNRRFYTCHGFTGPRGGHDVRVVAWRTNDSLTSAQIIDTLVSGIQTSTGRHGGCRLRLGGKGALFVGTGDAAVTGSARDRSSLAGKVLRVNRRNGNALPTNPFINSSNANTRKLWTFGHRNVQGLALRPGGNMWSVEHGTYRDDEVNLLRPGGDYGWEAGPGYDESPPMTDHSLPGPQIDAEWSSGNPTVATSGATWLKGPRWGDWNGALAVAALKDQSVRIMRFGSGRLQSVERPTAFTDYGRLRTAQLGPGNVLYLTTDNGGGNDRVLAVTAQP